MDEHDKLLALTSRISAGESIDWTAVKEEFPNEKDWDLLLRLKGLAATTVATEPGSPSPSSDSPEADAPQLTVGDRIADRYRIEAFIDRGGMGEVYRATDELLGARVALKTILPRIASNPSSLRRFKKEVLLARSITHSNVCRIFELQWDEGRGIAFLTMEFLAGETLMHRVLNSGPLTAADALPLIRQLADGLDSAHRAGIVHRDFKSGNVMLVPDVSGERAVILDFGLAKELGLDTTDTSATITMTALSKASPRLEGTPAYMAPEQVTSGDLSPATDLYALGVVLFEIRTGQLPFQRRTPTEMALAHVVDAPPPMEEFAELDTVWGKTIARLLSKDPNERYQSATDVVLALEGRLVVPEDVPHSLPAERDAFIGRTSELAALASSLCGPNSTRLLTLLGAGGTGKTRLAQRYGWENLARWPGGVWFCDLTEAVGIDGIVHSVATSLDVPLGSKDPVVQLGDAIAGHGRCLVILDNFEQVTEKAEATLGCWIQSATEATFLVTSQARLQLPEETPYELPPLDPKTQAVDLFEARARGHCPDFSIDESNREQVLEIVNRLDSLPLAIELAASRLRMLSLEQLRDRLQDRFRILTGGKHGRHSTLRATLDWSWELLQPWEQSAIAQASVFEGGFTLEAAEAVIDLSDQGDSPFVLDIIQSLVDKSWLRTRTVIDAPRFDTYRTVQEYASAKLSGGMQRAGGCAPDSSAVPMVESRHGTYFARMGTDEAIERLDLRGATMNREMAQSELDNLIVACNRGIDRGDDKIAAAAYLAAAALLDFRGPFALSVQLGRKVLAAVEMPMFHGRILRTLAGAELDLAETEVAREHYAAALAVHRKDGDRKHEGRTLNGLGHLDLMQNRGDKAHEHFRSALVILRESGDRVGEASVLRGLGLFHFYHGRIPEAVESSEAALIKFREVGHQSGEGSALGNLGAFYHANGQISEASKYYEEARKALRETGQRSGEAIALNNLGTVHIVQGGRLDEAQEYYEAALTILQEVGDRLNTSLPLSCLGHLHLDQGRLDAAQEHFEAALVIDRDAGDPRGEARAILFLGIVHSKQGRVVEASDCYDTVLRISRDLGDPSLEGTVLGRIADLQCEQSPMSGARRRFDESISILRGTEERLELGRVLSSLGRFEVQQSNTSAARTALTEAESIAADLVVTPESELARKIEELRVVIEENDS